MPLATLSARERAQFISFVPQRSELASSMPVWDVVAMGRFAHGKWLRTLSATDDRIIHEAMIATDTTDLAQRAYTELSGGEQSRVILARALASDAPILLLDEPTAHLDLEHALTCYHVLRRMADAGRTIIIVMHQLNHALEWSDEAVVVHQGHLVGHGPTSDVLNTDTLQQVFGLVPAGQQTRFALIDRASDGGSTA